jgi:hypothetical protein
MCLMDFLVQPHNVLAMEPSKANPATRRGPTQAFINNEPSTHRAIAELGKQEAKLEQQ